MKTRVTLDEALVERAMAAGGHRTIREAVTAALEAYVKSRGRFRILEMFGKVDFDPDWDHKASRRLNNKRRRKTI